MGSGWGNDPDPAPPLFYGDYNNYERFTVMARRIKGFVFPSDGVNPEKYPWREWLDGSTWRALSGYDYECTTETFIMRLRLKAKRTNHRVRITEILHRGTEGVMFQFSPTPPPKKIRRHDGVTIVRITR